LLVCGTLFLLGFACKGGDEKTAAPVNSAANVSSGTPSSASTATASASTKDLAGTYAITGTNEGGSGNYAGTLLITNRDDVYQFSWDTAGKKYDGVGVRTDNNVAVAFTDGNDGTGCGVVLYTIQSDGTLDGKAGYWGKNSSEMEIATRTKGTDLEGEYSISGSNPDGGKYTGTLGVKKSGAGYAFTWDTGSTLRGFGIRQDDKVSVGFGSKQCGFVGYTVKSDGTLEGKWGSTGSTSVGTETAKKN
jgi:hypothetical protein